MSRAFMQFKVLIAKDLKQEFRSREMLSSMGLYALLVLIVFGCTVAFSADDAEILPFAPGLFWAMLIFTSLLGLNRSFNREQQNCALEGLLLAPIERSAIFFAKAISNFIFILAVELVSLPVFYFLFLADCSLPASAWLVLFPLLLGALGIAGVGTLMSTLSLRSQSKDVLLALLLIPLVYPLLYACVASSGAVLLAAADMDVFAMGLALAAGYDAIMLLAAWVLYGFAIEA